MVKELEVSNSHVINSLASKIYVNKNIFLYIIFTIFFKFKTCIYILNLFPHQLLHLSNFKN